MTWATAVAALSNKVAWYKLDEAAGATSAVDAVAARNGAVGTGVTMGATSLLGDASGKAASLNGSGAIVVTAASAFNFEATDFSVIAIVNPSSIPTSGSAYLISRRASWGLLFRDGAPSGFTYDSGGGIFNYVKGTVGDVGVNGSYLLVFSYVNATKTGTLYVGNSVKATLVTSAVPAASAYDLTIGQYGDGDDYLTGVLDELVLRNSATSAAEVATLVTGAALPAGGGGGGTGAPVYGGTGSEYQPRLVIPSYWSSTPSKYDSLAGIAPSGTIFCSVPGFQNSVQWYLNNDGTGGPGPGQAQTRQQSVVDFLARCHAQGWLMCPYVACNGGNSGVSVDGYYTDMAAVLAKIDLCYSMYPEYDGIFVDEANYHSDANMQAIRDRVKGHTEGRGQIVVMNLAGYQQSDTAQTYGDFLVLAETTWDGSSGFSGPYGAADPGSPDFLGQPGFVANWPRAKIVYWICGVPNTAGMAKTARAKLYSQGNVGAVYLADQAAYYSRWAGPAANPLMAEQAALSPVYGATSAPPPVDTAGPVIAGIAATSVSPTQETITGTTDKAASTIVRYGTVSGSYGAQTTPGQVPGTSWAANLKGLAPSTRYYFVVVSTAKVNGVTTTSAEQSFVTAAASISGILISGITTTGATIGWQTSAAANSQVAYGPTTAYGSTTTLDANLVTSHSQALTGLTPGTTYHAQVRSGSVASADFTFTTTAAPVTYTLTISAQTTGFTTLSTSTATYAAGTVVPVSVAPQPGYVLDHWTVDGANVGIPNPLNVTMGGNHTVVAFFAPGGAGVAPGGTAGSISPGGSATVRVRRG